MGTRETTEHSPGSLSPFDGRKNLRRGDSEAGRGGRDTDLVLLAELSQCDAREYHPYNATESRLLDCVFSLTITSLSPRLPSRLVPPHWLI